MSNVTGSSRQGAAGNSRKRARPAGDEGEGRRSQTFRSDSPEGPADIVKVGEIRVGSGAAAKSWTVHIDRFTALSPWLKRAFARAFLDQPGAAILVVRISDEDPRIFEWIHNWIYAASFSGIGSAPVPVINDPGTMGGGDDDDEEVIITGARVKVENMGDPLAAEAREAAPATRQAAPATAARQEAPATDSSSQAPIKTENGGDATPATPTVAARQTATARQDPTPSTVPAARQNAPAAAKKTRRRDRLATGSGGRSAAGDAIAAAERVSRELAGAPLTNTQDGVARQQNAAARQNATAAAAVSPAQSATQVAPASAARLNAAGLTSTSSACRVKAEGGRSPETVGPAPITPRDLMELYLLAKKLEIYTLGNAAMDGLHVWFHPDTANDRRPRNPTLGNAAAPIPLDADAEGYEPAKQLPFRRVPWLTDVAYVFSKTPEDNSLRRLLICTCVMFIFSPRPQGKKLPSEWKEVLCGAGDIGYAMLKFVGSLGWQKGKNGVKDIVVWPRHSFHEAAATISLD